jgi:hypothetical protein
MGNGSNLAVLRQPSTLGWQAAVPSIDQANQAIDSLPGWQSGSVAIGWDSSPAELIEPFTTDAGKNAVLAPLRN